jgi:hypothetical protein
VRELHEMITSGGVVVMAKATIYVLQSTVALLQDCSFRNAVYTRSDHQIHPVNSQVYMNHVQLSLSLPACATVPPLPAMRQPRRTFHMC